MKNQLGIFFLDFDECEVGFCGKKEVDCVNFDLSYDCVCEDGYFYDSTIYGSNCSGKKKQQYSSFALIF